MFHQKYIAVSARSPPAHTSLLLANPPARSRFIINSALSVFQPAYFSTAHDVAATAELVKIFVHNTAHDRREAPISALPTSSMALNDVGSLVLNLLIFITTLVNFSYALTTLEPLLLLALYAVSKIFVVAPEQGILAKCQHKYLYQEG